MTGPADLSNLTATVAHELVTPLAVISSAAHLLRRQEERDRDPSETDEIVAAIERNVTLAQLVVESLRTLDIEKGDIQLSRRSVDIVQLVRTTITDLERTLLRKHPTEVRVPAPAVAVAADPPRIRQVLVNLLSNAAKYSPPGRDIVVEVRERADTVDVVVRDRGHGVSPDDAERIFEKWERADDATSGLGLGLHLARMIARAHDGELRLEPAEKDDGAVFVLELPAAGDADGRDVPDARRG